MAELTDKDRWELQRLMEKDPKAAFAFHARKLAEPVALPPIELPPPKPLDIQKDHGDLLRRLGWEPQYDVRAILAPTKTSGMGALAFAEVIHSARMTIEKAGATVRAAESLLLIDEIDRISSAGVAFSGLGIPESLLDAYYAQDRPADQPFFSICDDHEPIPEGYERVEIGAVAKSAQPIDAYWSFAKLEAFDGTLEDLVNKILVLLEKRDR